METDEPASNEVVEEPASNEVVKELASNEVVAEEVEELLRQKQNKRFEKLRKRLMKDAKKAQNKGVCYLSRIPPKMDPLKLRHLLTPFGEVLRIYLVPEDPDAGKRRKHSGSFRGQGFSEGWVEFSDKRVAKRVANMLNGEQIGGKKRSKFYYDIWNIKYLSKFKWDDLTDESARKNAAREEKLRMELVAAKKEKDFYISKVEMSRALSEIEERMKKKRKTQNGTEDDSEDHIEHRKVIRQFPQKQPLAEPSEKNQLKLSKGFLAEIFNKN
ncbi:pre-rRNA-processing protein ESF2-like [Silene latifolia]|uniref:pre-rRNA-processing protein ESF2-like n=1 Tax=Silene latifolia TaxID=37657 RepID=UPI003D771240